MIIRSAIIAMCLAASACAQLPAYFHVVFDRPVPTGTEDTLVITGHKTGSFEETVGTGYFGADFVRNIKPEQVQKLDASGFEIRFIVEELYDEPSDSGEPFNLAIEFCLYDSQNLSGLNDPCGKSDSDDLRASWFIETPFYPNKETRYNFDLSTAAFERGAVQNVQRVSKCQVGGCISGPLISDNCEVGTTQHFCETDPNVPFAP